ncbi:2-C-methyl-D-erythritol 2,4-cyclodiphosphate synthase [Microbulbifer guangxiensis]|uniref:2-C-methyl-D-erythritol 2,4-cyclodiphosphate synthase n=1 Tax=Microbulbifer guangxiensis TaxID=2904249 RepID=UPI001F012CB3|nr:2-C-methyl-D-erythritol 2,4-cyclodiphosphate synthase [Microbulbifer guangxiensis]
MRIGQGFDVHAFCEGDHVMLGGVRIPHDRGLRAHSDGDVLLHALADALLGALALGDIGHHFPDTDPAYSGADSRQLLRHVIGLIREHGYSLVNADCTLIAQTPKMAPHIENMRSNIAADCDVDVAAVSVKATTTERLGFTGRGEGIAAQAAILLARHGKQDS